MRKRNTTRLLSGTLAASISVLGLAPAFALTPSTTNLAEISGSDAFVRNSWVQGGLKANGTFGSENAAPAGFNNSPNRQQLGLIEDPDENGFDTTVNGDFFLPGGPYEAWGIKVGNNPKRWNDDEDTAIAGSWTSSSTTADASVTWDSTSPVDGISVQKVISAPRTGEHLLKIFVTLTNTTGQEQVVYFARQVDPDNNKDSEDESDGVDHYSTFNRVFAQSDSSQVVGATAFAPFSTVGYRAADANAAVRISDWDVPLWSELDENEPIEYSLAEMDAVFAAMRTTYKVGFQDYRDSTIDIVFRKVVPANGNATLEFDYILSPGLINVPEYALDLDLALEVGGAYSGAETFLAGGGLAPNSAFTLTEFSEPLVIFSGTTLPNGNFLERTALPVDCRPGSHTLVLSGTAPNGTAVSDKVTYTVDDTCTVTAFDPYAGAADLAGLVAPAEEAPAATAAPATTAALATTGPDTWVTMGMLLGALAIVGFGARLAFSGRRKA